MTRNALVVGAETFGLGGVHHDVETMTALLRARGFTVRPCTGKDASRAGILDEYERLITGSVAGDAVVIYYSGHGGLARATTDQPDVQFIVPTDFDESGPDDFRGITDLELSVLQARLTAVTRNVTFLADCCHSSHMSRDPDLVPRSLPRATYVDIAGHLDRARRAGLDIDLPHVVSNPDAVRVVACAPWESAYEYQGVRGHRTGMFTESLSVALDETGGAPVTWSTLIERIRTRVMRFMPVQRPEVEGPASRLLFETARGRAGVLPVVTSGRSRISLPGARMFGVQVGDEFAVLPGEAERFDAGAVIAVATVDRFEGTVAGAALDFRGGHDEVPFGAQAYPLRTGAPRQPVAVRGVGVTADLLRTAIAAAPLVRAAEAGEDQPLAEVEVGADLSLHDQVGPLVQPRTADPAGVDVVVDDLDRLARAAALRQLAPGPDETLEDEVTVEWGRVVDGRPEPLEPTGSLVHVGDRLYFRVRNDSDRDLYVCVCDLGVSGAVSIITTADRSGLRLEPRQEHVIGQRRYGGLVGSAVIWPPGVPAARGRSEAVLVIVTPVPQDLSMLEQRGLGDAVSRAIADGRRGSSLQRLVTQRTAGGRREIVTDDDAAEVPFAVRRIEFTLSPAPRPAGETARFLVDERPDASVRLLPSFAQTRAASVPSTVAVRLNELVVHRNRALGGADVRVDALVLTGGSGSSPAYRARTARFANVRDGNRLPLDNLLVYHGPAVDYLDLAWWVSRDRRGSLELSDLLRDALNAEDVQQAAVHLAGLAVAAPQATAAVLAVGAGAVIVNTAYRLLSGVVGDSIGLYRTSLLASEGFGVGRHPASGLYRAQDFGFAYEIVPA